MARNYIIVTPSFNENSGGTLFLHHLAHELNSMGERALLWRIGKKSHPKLYAYPRWIFRQRGLKTCPDLDTPLARWSDLTPDSIVIYPELVLGNPLGASNVARWLLYRPGLRHPYEFGPQEIFFTAGPMSDIPEVTGGAPELFLWIINRTYRNENRPDRNGVCYIVRKGNQKPRIPETEAADAICIDGMTHAEINDVFNRCHTFYSYDEATMYSQYAAVAGCTSVVVPGLYETREDWAQNHKLGRYGIAYGVDDIAHAQATQHKVLDLLRAEEAKGKATVENFVTLTKEHFWGHSAVERAQVV